MSDRSAGLAPPRLVAVLGPTNTGKTHLAVERMLGHASGMIGLPLRLLAREIYDRIVKLRGPRAVCTDHGRGEDRSAQGDLFRLHGRSDATLPRGRVPGHRRGAALRRPHARPRLHRPPAARPGNAGDHVPGRRHRRSADPAAPAPLRDRDPRAVLGADLRRLEKADPPAAPHGRRRVQRGECLRHCRADPPPAGRSGGGDGPRSRRAPRNAQVALYQNGEVDFLVATDAIGHGPEHGRRPRGPSRGCANSTARRPAGSPRRRSARSPAAPGASGRTARSG